MVENLKKILKVIKRIREIFDSNNYRNHIEFKNFPNGSCYASSVLLGLYLRKNGFGNFEIVFSSRNEKTHVWLQNDKYYIEVV